MLNTSARLLRLLSLLQTRRYWSGAELAESLAIDPRTLRRDVDRLRQLGINVQAASGVGGGYQLVAGTDLQPLLFDEDEAVAVAVALRAASVIVGGIETAAVRVLAKLDQLLPARLQRQASAVHAVTATLPVEMPRPDADLLIGLSVACRDRKLVGFAYTSHAGEASQREVEPHHVINYGRRWYLIAWDRHRRDWRSFRLDRVVALAPSSLRFDARELGMAPLDYLRKAISVAPFERQASLIVAAPAAALELQVPAWLGALEALDAGTTRVVVAADHAGTLLAKLAMIEADWRLEQARDFPELDQALQRLQARLAASRSGEQA